MPLDGTNYRTADTRDATMRRWAEELRSGRHEQHRGGYGALITRDPRCVVAVLLNMLLRDSGMLSSVSSRVFLQNIAAANDEGSSFDELAHMIELYADLQAAQ